MYVIKVIGMSCAHCVSAIESAVLKVDSRARASTLRTAASTALTQWAQLIPTTLMTCMVCSCLS